MIPYVRCFALLFSVYLSLKSSKAKTVAHNSTTLVKPLECFHYTVIKGDSCSRIAETFGLNETYFSYLNPNIECEPKVNVSRQLWNKDNETMLHFSNVSLVLV